MKCLYIERVAIKQRDAMKAQTTEYKDKFCNNHVIVVDGWNGHYPDFLKYTIDFAIDSGFHRWLIANGFSDSIKFGVNYRGYTREILLEKYKVNLELMAKQDCFYEYYVMLDNELTSKLREIK